jgi:hypothetical protein
MVLKGANNLKILRQLRELNPKAQIIVHAELLTDIPALYAAGADYVTRRACSKPPTCCTFSNPPKKTCSTTSAPNNWNSSKAAAKSFRKNFR